MRVGKITRLELVDVVKKCFIQLQARFSSLQEGLITGYLSGSSIINVDEIVTVVLSSKIFQRKQSSQFCILEMQHNKWNA